MRLLSLNGNNISFGLNIIKNSDYEKIIRARTALGESKKDINDSFERISKLCDDNISLEFSNTKKELYGIMGITALMSNIRLKGLMRASDSNKLYPVDKYTEEKCVSDDGAFLEIKVKELLKEERQRIDIEDWK